MKMQNISATPGKVPFHVPFSASTLSHCWIFIIIDQFCLVLSFIYLESYGMYSFVNSFLAFFSLGMFLRFIHVCNLLFPFKKILGIHLCSHSYLQFLFIYHSVPEHKYVFKWKFSIPYFKKITLLYSCTCLLVHMQKLISVWQEWNRWAVDQVRLQSYQTIPQYFPKQFY